MKPIAVELKKSIQGYDSIAPIYRIEAMESGITVYCLSKSDGSKGGSLASSSLETYPERYRLVYPDVTPLLEEAEALLEELEVGYEWRTNTGEIPEELSHDDLVEVRYMNTNFSDTTYPYHAFYWEIKKGDSYAIKEYRKVRG